jgi:NAD dependent epimerase/dehydratase family enzyme
MKITGATGFVGTNLQGYLKTSHTIEVASIRYVPKQRWEFKTAAIIHLASKAQDLKNVSQPQDFMMLISS